MKFNVRILRKKDALILRDVRLNALRDSPHSFGGIYEEESKKPLAYWEDMVTRKLGDRVIFAAEYKKTVIGTLFCFCREDGSGGFGGMWVDPTYRNKGVASALVKQGIMWAKKMGVTKITLWNTKNNEAAKHLYMKSGFTPTGNTRTLESDNRFTIEELVRTI